MIQIERFVEVPNTNIQEPVLASQFADELCLSISEDYGYCLLYTSPSPRDATLSRMPSSA